MAKHRMADDTAWLLGAARTDMRTAEARIAELEAALRSCRNLTHLQHETPQDVRQIALMVAATVDKALTATGKAAE